MTSPRSPLTAPMAGPCAPSPPAPSSGGAPRLATALRRQQVLPGFLGSGLVTVSVLGSLVVLPLCALLVFAARVEPAAVAAALTDARVLAALRLSFGASLFAASVSVPIGLLLAWVLGRHEFPGRRAMDALVDIPFALPTAVSGIALAWLYGPHGWVGQLLAPLGIQVAFQRAGIVLALIFIGLPLVVRSIQPVVAELRRDHEEAAATLGATGLQTFLRVTLPALRPALLTGFALSFARGVGEYGSVIFIAGNMPLRTEVAPLLIVSRLEMYDYAGAFVIAVAMLAVSACTLLLLGRIQRAREVHHGS